LLRWLKIQLASEEEAKGFDLLNDMVVDQIMRGLFSMFADAYRIAVRA